MWIFSLFYFFGFHYQHELFILFLLCAFYVFYAIAKKKIHFYFHMKEMSINFMYWISAFNIKQKSCFSFKIFTLNDLLQLESNFHYFSWKVLAIDFLHSNSHACFLQRFIFVASGEYFSNFILIYCSNIIFFQGIHYQAHSLYTLL